MSSVVRYLPPVSAVVMACPIFRVRLPPSFAVLSSTPRTVTVWATSHRSVPVGLKVSVSAFVHERPAAGPSTCTPVGAVAVTVTGLSGCVSSTTV